MAQLTVLLDGDFQPRNGFHHRIISVFKAVPPEGLKITEIIFWTVDDKTFEASQFYTEEHYSESVSQFAAAMFSKIREPLAFIYLFLASLTFSVFCSPHAIFMRHIAAMQFIMG